MRALALAAVLLLSSAGCLADRRLLHGGHAHEEAAEAAAAQAPGAAPEAHHSSVVCHP